MADVAEAHAHPHSPHLAHQFEDMGQQRATASLGMWTFLATEVMFFGGMFAAYCIYRFTNPDAFALACRHLSWKLGSLNTAVLLSSSLTVALAVHAGQTGDRKGQVRYLMLTIVLGLAFLGIKAVEYWTEFEDHLVPFWNFSVTALHAPADASERTLKQAEMFFVFYFFMTGLHAFHMIIGIGVFIAVAAMAERGRFTPEYHTPLELSGLYWHFVDVVWVFLYPLLYLIDLHK
ncbi:MAG: cytochrome c oxidase subunit 3 family protein [Isosphaeraceae bacterium]|nr:cytochrome c oxidase subunit 3 family protein [Isosphaeraceae bacterium]